MVTGGQGDGQSTEFFHNGKWTPGPDIPYNHRRFGHCQVLLGDTIYTTGGFHSNPNGGYMASTLKLTQDGWVEGGSLAVAREDFACAVHFGKIFAIGGRGYRTSGLSSVEIFDPLSETWSFGPYFPQAVTDAQAISWNESLWVMGGWNNTIHDYNNVLYRLEEDGWKDTGIIVNENGAGRVLPAQIVGRDVINC